MNPGNLRTITLVLLQIASQKNPDSYLAPSRSNRNAPLVIRDRFLFLLAAGLLLAGSAPAATVQPNAILNDDQLASRFLAQATFGPTPEAIAALRAAGYDYNAWIDREVAKPASYATPLVVAALASGSITKIQNFENRCARNQVMIGGDDQLRQRVAYELSQIFVVSDANSDVANADEGSCSYYDLLVRDSFTTFRQLLVDVTYSPIMGRYLNQYRNRRANPAKNTVADENYARETQQLFSIGLYQLNANGTYQTDANGRPLETYTNNQITEFAKVFTGLTDEDHNPSAKGTGAGQTDFPNAKPNYTEPMKMWPGQHDVTAKSLHHYAGARKPDLPAGQSGDQDISDAIDNLVEHPNTAPFISRQLIQRLVTSNPSDGYVSRVSATFLNNGRGQRGDMLAVIKAVLLDPEARSVAFISDPEHGKLREPYVRLTHLLRAFHYQVSAGAGLRFSLGNANENTLGQFPLASPTVFNFYAPDYSPRGPIGDAGLVAPEFQIQNAVFGIATPNFFYNLATTYVGVGNFSLGLGPQIALTESATDLSPLLDNVDLLLTAGTLSATSRATILATLNAVTPSMLTSNTPGTLAMARVQLAIYLVAISPDYAIQK
ncbi:MAG: hypothetical protein DUW69_001360 [Verrucomicrobia bacterium]|nr:MAG: hypothetical protein DUW69_001360 [Verrucomicrobiota bacterium]